MCTQIVSCLTNFEEVEEVALEEAEEKGISEFDTLEDEVEDEVQAKRTRFDSRPMSKYEQLRERNIAERKQMEDELFGEV